MAIRRATESPFVELRSNTSPPKWRRGTRAFTDRRELLRRDGTLIAVLICAAATARFIAALRFDAPWIAADEMVYGLTGRGLWETGRLELLGADAPFYGLYPVLIGLPLAALSTAAGVIAVQAVQALAASATAAIVFYWARPVAGRRYALAAAVMTLALPAIAYSGLLMTEGLFLLATTFALWRLSAALVRPTRANQLLVVGGVIAASLVRFQGLSLVLTLIASTAVMALLTRDRGILRRLVLAQGAALGFLLAWLFLARSTSGSSLGAYGVTAESGFGFDSVKWVGWHIGAAFLLVAVVPLFASLMLAWNVATSRETGSPERALVATTFSYLTIAVTLVGLFASEHVGRIAERDLGTVAPPLFVAFAVWLGAGMRRPQPAVSIVGLVTAAALLLMPFGKLVPRVATPDALTTTPFFLTASYFSFATAEIVWSAVIAAIILLALLLPSRFAAPSLVSLVAVLLAVTSVSASIEIARRSAEDRVVFFGYGPRDWIDRRATEPVAYLYTGHPLWNGVWHAAFWNRRIESIGVVGAPTLPGPVPGVELGYLSNGQLVRNDGQTLSERLVVAPARLTLRGKRVTTHARGPGADALALWRSTGPPALSTRTVGLDSDGMTDELFVIEAFDCGGGILRMTASGFGRSSLSYTLDGGSIRTTVVDRPGLLLSLPGPEWDGSTRRCVYRFKASDPVHLSRVDFERPHRASAAARTAKRIAPVFPIPTQLSPEPRVRSDIDVGSGRHLGYCIRGVFVQLLEGQPVTDPRYRDATPAIFVEGKGITCGVPPSGFVRRGFAGAERGVPESVYPLYVPAERG